MGCMVVISSQRWCKKKITELEWTGWLW